ncbi:MAG: GtrA family protein [Candidatus Magasanikbacteria bacterium]|nr:GtrA family protein [Candidatus Magasanikbacteria bacterium]
MVKRFIAHLWSARREFAKYFIIGVSGVALDIGSLYVLKEYVHWSAVAAVIVNQAVLINYGFFLNKYWAFKSTGITHRQIIRYYLLALANYLFSIFWMWFFHDRFGFNYLLTRVANIALAVTWNFLLYKHWVYGGKANISQTEALTSIPLDEL